MRPHPPEIVVLLSTFNGARYLQAQLDSLAAQSHADWRLLWRDDGSDDATVAIMETFAAGRPVGQCRRVEAAAGRLHPTASYMLLLREAALCAPDATVAFADQDDVWLTDKLARGAAALADADPAVPTLYSARQILVDAALREIGPSMPIVAPPGFPASLTQNLATGCTVMMNAAATRLVAGSTPSPAALHDWWCYLLVTAAGGRFIVDDRPVVLYRQHGANLVGAPPSMHQRAVAALRRGPAVFMRVLRQNVDALADQPHLLTAAAREQVAMLQRALARGPRHRLAALRLPGLRRQTWSETLLFRLWFLFG